MGRCSGDASLFRVACVARSSKTQCGAILPLQDSAAAAVDGGMRDACCIHQEERHAHVGQWGGRRGCRRGASGWSTSSNSSSSTPRQMPTPCSAHTAHLVLRRRWGRGGGGSGPRLWGRAEFSAAMAHVPDQVKEHRGAAPRQRATVSSSKLFRGSGASSRQTFRRTQGEGAAAQRGIFKRPAAHTLPQAPELRARHESSGKHAHRAGAPWWGRRPTSESHTQQSCARVLAAQPSRDRRRTHARMHASSRRVCVCALLLRVTQHPSPAGHVKSLVTAPREEDQVQGSRRHAPAGCITCVTRQHHHHHHHHLPTRFVLPRAGTVQARTHHASQSREN